jgi:hypothetical protein
MADTRAHHATAEHPVPSIPVEGDGISYRGLFWFGVILTITTVFCAALVWGMFVLYERREIGRDAVRAPLAPPRSTPSIDPVGGRVNPGHETSAIGLLVDEPAALHQFRTREDDMLRHYGWVDRNAGTIRLPIDRAKDLLLQRGLPVRGATAPAVPATATKGKQ